MPGLLPANRPLFHCFTLCDTQLRLGISGVYSMDWAVIQDVAVSMHIEIDECFYRLLRSFERSFLGELHSRGTKGGTS